jgi:hypothetical protein
MTKTCRRCRLLRMRAYAPSAVKERIGSLFRSRLMRTRVDNVDSRSSSRTILVLQGFAGAHFSGGALPKRLAQRARKAISFCKIRHLKSVNVVTGGCDDNVDNINGAAFGCREEIILPGAPNADPPRARCARAGVRLSWRPTHD